MRICTTSASQIRTLTGTEWSRSLAVDVNVKCWLAVRDSATATPGNGTRRSRTCQSCNWFCPLQALVGVVSRYGDKAERLLTKLVCSEVVCVKTRLQPGCVLHQEEGPSAAEGTSHQGSPLAIDQCHYHSFQSTFRAGSVSAGAQRKSKS